MFALGAAGGYLPVEIGAGATNLSIFATRTQASQIQLTVINKSEKPASLSVSFTGEVGRMNKVQSIELSGTTNFGAAEQTVTVGGAQIQSDGNWARN